MTTSRPIRVHVIFECNDGVTPFGCSHIRLIRPLTHPAVAKQLSVTFGAKLPNQPLDVVVVERLGDHTQVEHYPERLFRELVARSLPYIFTIDDNLFALDGDFSTTALSRDQNLLLYQFVRYAAHIVVSTEQLASVVSVFNNNVSVVPNYLDERLFTRTAPKPYAGGKLKFGYMGTFTHLYDLLLVLQPLRSFLSMNDGGVSFEIVGIHEEQVLLGLFAGLDVSVKSVPNDCVEYTSFIKWIQRELDWDFAIAPLRNSPLNEAKSDLKVLDYGVLGIPGIFSDVTSYRKTVVNNVTGLLCSDDPSDWLAALRFLSVDHEARLKIATAVSEYVWSERMLEAKAIQHLEVFQAVLAERRPVGLSLPVARARCIQNTPYAMIVTRNDKLLHSVNTDGQGLEIGPGFCPVLAKADGYNVKIVDHAPAAKLREKYACSNVDVSRIEEVDYIWRGETLEVLTNKRSHFDFIVASHVIEHTPDLIGFITSCEVVLKPGGTLALAIPDHRFCFDRFRPVSTLGDVLQAHLEKRTTHTPGTVFDHHFYSVSLDGEISWSTWCRGKYEAKETFLAAKAAYEHAAKSSEYIDVHNWRFTLSSFLMVMQALGELGFTSMGVASSFPTNGCEFIVSLVKGLEVSNSIERIDYFTLIKEEENGVE